MEKEDVKQDINDTLEEITLTDDNIILFKTLLIINIILMIIPMVGGIVALGVDLLLTIIFVIKKIYLDSKKENKEYDVDRFNNSFNNRTCFLLACFSFISIFADFGCSCIFVDYIILSIFYVLVIFLPLIIMYLKKASNINGDYKELNRIFISFILTVIVVGLLMKGLVFNIDKSSHMIITAS